mmetsp:Transcript_12695/g.16569  ORF Transcript_12695/g.16569 Transcript_12695/m.16569 type:complete len:433 (-) Transcript_12695:613-1911(-)
MISGHIHRRDSYLPSSSSDDDDDVTCNDPSHFKSSSSSRRKQKLKQKPLRNTQQQQQSFHSNAIHFTKDVKNPQVTNSSVNPMKISSSLLAEEYGKDLYKPMERHPELLSTLEPFRFKDWNEVLREARMREDGHNRPAPKLKAGCSWYWYDDKDGCRRRKVEFVLRAASVDARVDCVRSMRCREERRRGRRQRRSMDGDGGNVSSVAVNNVEKELALDSSCGENAKFVSKRSRKEKSFGNTDDGNSSKRLLSSGWHTAKRGSKLRSVSVKSKRPKTSTHGKTLFESDVILSQGDLADEKGTNMQEFSSSVDGNVPIKRRKEMKRVQTSPGSPCSSEWSDELLDFDSPECIKMGNKKKEYERKFLSNRGALTLDVVSSTHVKKAEFKERTKRLSKLKRSNGRRSSFESLPSLARARMKQTSLKGYFSEQGEPS